MVVLLVVIVEKISIPGTTGYVYVTVSEFELMLNFILF